MNQTLICLYLSRLQLRSIGPFAEGSILRLECLVNARQLARVRIRIVARQDGLQLARQLEHLNVLRLLRQILNLHLKSTPLPLEHVNTLAKVFRLQHGVDFVLSKFSINLFLSNSSQLPPVLLDLRVQVFNNLAMDEQGLSEATLLDFNLNLTLFQQ